VSVDSTCERRFRALRLKMSFVVGASLLQVLVKSEVLSVR